MKFPARRLLVLLCWLSLVSTGRNVAAQEAAGVSNSFRVILNTEGTEQAGDQKRAINAQTDFVYSWKHEGRDRLLTFLGLKTTIKINGMLAAEIVQSRDRMRQIQGGKTEELSGDTMPPKVREALEDMFGAPVWKRSFDAEGNEVDHELLAKPGAKPLVENGLISNVVLFHPALPAGRDTWNVDAEISIGNGGLAKGPVTYKKIKGNEYSVSGTLVLKDYQAPGTPITVNEARTVISGTQTYDPKRQDWSSAKLKMDQQVKMSAQGQPPATVTNTTTATLELLPAKQ